MMCAGWIRFGESVAMRRTSWIDQRIKDALAMLLSLPWFGVSFFLAVADWRDGGSPPSWRRRASPKKRGDATHAIHELAATQPKYGNSLGVEFVFYWWLGSWTRNRTPDAGPPVARSEGLPLLNRRPDAGLVRR